MSFVVELASAHVVDTHRERYDVSRLDDDRRSHIHGELRVLVRRARS